MNALECTGVVTITITTNNYTTQTSTEFLCPYTKFCTRYPPSIGTHTNIVVDGKYDRQTGVCDNFFP